MIALDRLQQIIPADQALANKALQVALQQITGISQTSLSSFATAVSLVETNKDLPDINSLTQAVPQNVLDFYKQTYAKGTGENNTVLITDILGTAAGTVSAQALEDSVIQLTVLKDANQLDTLTTVYNTMSNVVDGVYGDPFTGPIIIPSGPWAGSYTDADTVFSTVLIPAAISEIGVIISANPDSVALLNQYFNDMGVQLSREFELQELAGLVFDDLIANEKTSVNAFISSLPTYALNTEVGGTSDYISHVTDATIQGGQAILATLRSGRNQEILDAVGIATNGQVPDAPAEIPPQISLTNTEYTSQEAKNKIIT